MNKQFTKTTEPLSRITTRKPILDGYVLLNIKINKIITCLFFFVLFNKLQTSVTPNPECSISTSAQQAYVADIKQLFTNNQHKTMNSITLEILKHCYNYSNECTVVFASLYDYFSVYENSAFIEYIRANILFREHPVTKQYIYQKTKILFLSLDIEKIEEIINYLESFIKKKRDKVISYLNLVENLKGLTEVGENKLLNALSYYKCLFFDIDKIYNTFLDGLNNRANKNSKDKFITKISKIKEKFVANDDPTQLVSKWMDYQGSFYNFFKKFRSIETSIKKTVMDCDKSDKENIIGKEDLCDFTEIINFVLDDKKIKNMLFFENDFQDILYALILRFKVKIESTNLSNNMPKENNTHISGFYDVIKSKLLEIKDTIEAKQGLLKIKKQENEIISGIISESAQNEEILKILKRPGLTCESDSYHKRSKLDDAIQQESVDSIKDDKENAITALEVNPNNLNEVECIKTFIPIIITKYKPLILLKLLIGSSDDFIFSYFKTEIISKLNEVGTSTNENFTQRILEIKNIDDFVANEHLYKSLREDQYLKNFIEVFGIAKEKTPEIITIIIEMEELLLTNLCDTLNQDQEKNNVVFKKEDIMNAYLKLEIEMKDAFQKFIETWNLLK